MVHTSEDGLHLDYRVLTYLPIYLRGTYLLTYVPTYSEDGLHLDDRVLDTTGGEVERQALA